MTQCKLIFSICKLWKPSSKMMSMIALMLFPFMSLMAQQGKTISGVVKSEESNMPIPGANVLVKGTSNGTVTNFDGEYSIKANENDVLIFSYVGFEPLEVLIGSNTTIDVALEEGIASLSEVVVVGYGSQLKQDLTGAVGIVDSEEMKKQATNDVTQMMQGRVAGVLVTSDGQPGASPNVRIRGVATFGQGASAEPLYVVDGFPLPGGIRDINPNDIESIQVLKDASAGAIYGNRAANGVVIITTKGGKKGEKFSVELNTYYGLQTIEQRIPVLDRQGYQTINNELLTNAGQPLVPGNDSNSPLFINDINTDWQNAGYKDGYIQNYNLNLSGGTEKTNYFISLDYLDNEGTLVGSGPDYKRYSFRVNSDTELGKFNIGENIYITRSDENPLFSTTSIGLPGSRPTLVNDLLQAAPTIPVFDENREGGFGGADSTIHQSITLNVPGINSLIDNQTEVNRYLANFYVNYEIIDGLDLKTSLTYDNTTVINQLFVPQYDLGYFFPNPTSQLRYGTTTSSSFLIENTINYNKKFGKHNLQALVGQTYQEFDFRAVNSTGLGLEKPYVRNLENATTFSVTDFQGPYTISSQLARVNYSYDDRYLITANIRRDGSSKFRDDLKYEYFPSVSAAWKIQNDFELPDFVQTLKLRGGIGEVGNQEISNPFPYQATINRGIPYSFSYGRAIGASTTLLVDPSIKWETRVTRSVGLDGSLYDGSIDFTAEYYSNTSNDVLTLLPIPFSNGSVNPQILTNAGSIENRGIELSASFRRQFGDFYLEVSPNFTTLNNEVLDIGNQEFISAAGSRTVVGRSIGEHYGWVYDGLFQSEQEVAEAAFQTPGTSPGDVIFKDLNDDGVIDDQDRTFLGKGLPTYNYGINIVARYKDFDFTIFGQGAGGHLINSNLYRGLMPTSGYTNWHEDILNRWTPQNTNTDVPRVAFLDPNNNGRDSNRPGWLQDGDYFRINTISLGYSLPESLTSKMSLAGARFYVTFQNVAVFSKYEGYNPDFQAGVLSPGFDFGTYPRPLTSMIGAQFKF